MKTLGILALSCAGAVLAPTEVRPSDVFVVQNLVPYPARDALSRAVVLARQQLARPACQRVLSEFSDASGRTLQENLDALGLTGGDYLGQIRFINGSRQRPCQTSRPFAFTTPGSRLVYVCGTEFRKLADERPRIAAAIVIHEALHTLGLGEDPPSTSEITQRVLARCH
jgi:hypothetical protein